LRPVADYKQAIIFFGNLDPKDQESIKKEMDKLS
jgi:hypothetical protein